jgi:hypothetical protein
MKWIYDDGNENLNEAALAEKGILAILENADFSSVPKDRADAAMHLLGRCIRELTEATESQAHARNSRPFAQGIQQAVMHE